MVLDWLRVGPELVRLNLQKARHARRIRRHPSAIVPPAPCQSRPDTGFAHETHCEACLRFDSIAVFRRVCPAVRLRREGAFCSLDSADIRPDWKRAGLLLLLPPLALGLVAGGVAWATLRFGGGLEKLSPLDVFWPPRWSQIGEHRRARFRDIAVRELRAGNYPTASIALFAAASSGRGNPEENTALARLAALGGFFSLSDEIHARDLAAFPENAVTRAIAWHDDLLIANRPAELARLALAQLRRADAPREFWLRAFLESIRHPGVAGGILNSDTAGEPPHLSLRHALLARQAIDRKDRIAATDALIAFAGNPPGAAARRFLVDSWRDLGEHTRSSLAAISTAHPAEPGEIASLAYRALRGQGRIDEARAVLRPLFAQPGLHPLALAALVAAPDAELLRAFDALLDTTTNIPPEVASAFWFAARRTRDDALVASAIARLARTGVDLPADLAVDVTDAGLLDRAVSVLPLERELLHALRAPR